MFYPLNAPNLKCVEKCQYAAAGLVSRCYVKDPAGLSPKRCSMAQCPTILSECPAEKIIKVIKIIYIFQKKRLTKHKEICFLKLSHFYPAILQAPGLCIPQSGVVAKKQSKRANQMRASLRKHDQLAHCLFQGKLLRIINFHVIMAAKTKVSIIDPPVSHQDCKNK